MAVTAGVIGTMGLVPGMPNLVFLTLAGIFGGAAYMIAQRGQAAKATEVMEPEAAAAQSAEPRELSWDDVGPVDIIGLEVGYRLIPLVDKNQGGQLDYLPGLLVLPDQVPGRLDIALGHPGHLHAVLGAEERVVDHPAQDEVVHFFIDLV